MATATTIILTGITYLMLAPVQQPDHLRVAIGKLDRATVSPQDPAHVLPEHVPFIAVSGKYLDTSKTKTTRPYDYKVSSGGSVGDTYIYILNYENIALGGVTSKTFSVPTVAPAKRLPFESNVQHISQFCPTCKNWTEAMFNKPDPTYTGAVLTVAKGQVSAIENAVGKCKWKFDKDAGQGGLQDVSMTQEVAVDVTVAPALTLLLTKITTGASSGQITLLPIAGATATIGSAPLPDIMLLKAGTMDDVDYHFGLYYLMLDPSDAKPHPLPTKSIAGCMELKHRLGGANCPPVQW